MDWTTTSSRVSAAFDGGGEVGAHVGFPELADVDCRGSDGTIPGRGRRGSELIAEQVIGELSEPTDKTIRSLK